MRHAIILAVGVFLVPLAGPGCGSSTDDAPAGGSGGTPFDDTGGDDACSTVLECLSGCAGQAEGSQACASACVAAGSTQARLLAGRIATCGQGADCGDLACTYAQCRADVDACLADGDGGLAGACSRYRACVTACSDDGCRKSCEDAAGTDALERSQALQGCAATFTCGDRACLEQNCLAQLLRCSS